MLIDGKPFLWDVNPPNLKAATLPEFWKGLTADAFKIFEVVLPRPGECFVILQIGQKVEVGYTVKTFSRRRAIERYRGRVYGAGRGKALIDRDTALRNG